MDLRQGRIRNLNKKIIVGALGISLLSSAIVGYSASNRIKFEKHRYENFTGIASFEKMKKCFFLEIYNKQDETTEYYIAEKKEFFDENGEVIGHFYLDLLEQKNIFIDELNSNDMGFVKDYNKTLVKELNMEEYLYSFENIETMYSAEDVKVLIEQMKQIGSNKTK